MGSGSIDSRWLVERLSLERHRLVELALGLGRGAGTRGLAVRQLEVLQRWHGDSNVVRGAMAAMADDARRRGVIPGVMRELLAEYRLVSDWW